MWTWSHTSHSQFFVCKLINAATASIEEQLFGGVWLTKRDTQVPLLLLSICKMTDCLNEVSMCCSIIMPQVEKKKKKAWTYQKAFTDWKVHSLGVFSTLAHAL